MKDLSERYLKAKRKIIDRYLGKSLNPDQVDAVRSVDGPLLIVAGAGSGKTTVLVSRIAFIIKYGNAYYSDRVPDIDENYLLDMEAAADTMPTDDLEGVISEFSENPCKPYNMLAITFTNKAANEIKARLGKIFGESGESEDIWAGTFHSVCVRILRREASAAGYGADFSIYDTEDKKHLLTDVMKDLNIDTKTLPIKTVANEISASKDALITPDMYEGSSFARARDIKKIYTEYQRRLKNFNAMDFDDLIAETVFLFKNHPEIAEYYAKKFHYICVDEYQDTNRAQFFLCEILASYYRNIMVVGDDDQSIYRFRGATVENILGFDKTYPEAKIVKLEQNYRSTKIILDAANAVISHNENRHKKELWCKAKEGDKIIIHTAFDQNDEARYIVNTITDEMQKGKKFSDFAVLYRINEIARSLESVFAKSGIPYRIVGGQRFYDKKEIRDMIAYLHVIENDRDDQRLKRIINEPKRKIGAAAVGAIEQCAADEGVSMQEIMRKSKDNPIFSRISSQLTAFTDLISYFRCENLTLDNLIEEVFTKTGYKQMLIDGGEVEKPRIDAVEELVSAAKEYAQRCEGEATLAGFLEEVALVSDVDKYDENADAVVLMTVHSAKGLEFPCVFIAAMEEGVFPSLQTIGEADEISEERRLAYVAITRAKQKLWISLCQNRLLYGHSSINKLSRFANDIPKQLTEYKGERKTSFERDFSYEYRRSIADLDMYSDYFGTKPKLSKEFEKKIEEPKKPTSFGVTHYAAGTRVAHQTFGDGTVVSEKNMGGDILYEVKFDSGETKRLMATYANLKKL